MAKLLRKDVLKWIKNLSDGSYKKTKKKLASDDGTGFCCLGVWVDQHGCYWRVRPSDEQLVPIPPKQKNPSKGQGCGTLQPNISFGLTSEMQSELADLNDTHKTWKQVIEFIKEHVLPEAK